MERRASRLRNGAMKVLTRGKTWADGDCSLAAGKMHLRRSSDRSAQTDAAFSFCCVDCCCCSCISSTWSSSAGSPEGFVCLGAGAEEGDFLRRAGNLERHPCLLRGLAGSFRFIDSPHCSGCARRKSKLGGHTFSSIIVPRRSGPWISGEIHSRHRTETSLEKSCNARSLILPLAWRRVNNSLRSRHLLPQKKKKNCR